MLLLKRGPKAPSSVRRAQSSAGARRRGVEHPELLVYLYVDKMMIFLIVYLDSKIDCTK